MRSILVEFEDSMKYSMNKGNIHWKKKADMVSDWHYWMEKALEETPVKPVK